MDNTHLPEETPPRAPGTLPQPDAFQANETIHWLTMTKTLLFTGIAILMIRGRFFAPHVAFEHAGLMVMGAGMILFVIGLLRGNIAYDDADPKPQDEQANEPEGH